MFLVLFRTVVSSGSSPSYQPTGTEGCFLGSPRFPSPSDGSFGPGQVTQFNSGCLHKPPGRYSFDSSLSRDSSTPYLVSSREDCVVCLPHSGSAEFSHGLPTPFCFSTDSSCVPSSVGGLIRLVPRSSAYMLLCESGRSRCLGSGCFFHSLIYYQYIHPPIYSMLFP